MSDQPEPLAAILAEMRDFCSGWSEDVDVTVKVGLIYGWKCRIEEAAKRQNHCEKRFDEDGNEMPPHCAFQSLRLDHALAERDALRKYIEKCRDYFADLTEAYNLEEERKLLEEARALLNETKGE